MRHVSVRSHTDLGRCDGWEPACTHQDKCTGSCRVCYGSRADSGPSSCTRQCLPVDIHVRHHHTLHTACTCSIHTADRQTDRQTDRLPARRLHSTTRAANEALSYYS